MNEAFGPEAETYAAEHLVRGEANTESREEQYSCPDTEPGQARLRMLEAS
jgi:hypothetical protein